MGRCFSAVSGRALSNGSETPLTQTLRTSFSGFKKEIYLPSGEIWAPAYSGLPKNTSRSMRAGCCAAAEKTNNDRNSVDKKSDFFIILIRLCGYYAICVELVQTKSCQV